MRVFIFNKLRAFEVLFVFFISSLIFLIFVNWVSIEPPFNKTEMDLYYKNIDHLILLDVIFWGAAFYAMKKFRPFALVKSILLRESDRVLVKIPKENKLTSGLVTFDGQRGSGINVSCDSGQTILIPKKNVIKILNYM